jgi:hypothetical protein
MTMTWSPDSSIAGGAQTNLSTPTYTLQADQASEPNAVQHAVTALGGTQTGVVAHSISKPFTITVVKPKVPKTLGVLNSVTGVRNGTIPKNTYWIIIRKGVDSSASDTNQLATVRVQIDVPAGADSYDAPNVRAMISLLVGILSEESADLGDTVVTGVL